MVVVRTQSSSSAIYTVGVRTEAVSVKGKYVRHEASSSTGTTGVGGVADGKP